MTNKVEFDNFLSDAANLIDIMLHNSDLFNKASLKPEDVISPEIELKAEIAGKSDVYHKVLELIKKINL